LTYAFLAGDAGNWLYIKQGTNWFPGWYKIQSVAGGKAMEAFASHVPTMVGGAADLSGSTRTIFPGGESEHYTETGVGRNVYFGVREHGMGAAVNGMAAHGGIVRPYGATFFTFSDYMRGAIRIAALSEMNVAYVFTHDSVALGEDGEEALGLSVALRLCVGEPDSEALPERLPVCEGELLPQCETEPLPLRLPLALALGQRLVVALRHCETVPVGETEAQPVALAQADALRVRVGDGDAAARLRLVVRDGVGAV
jgi:hypothetical protein